MSAQTSYVPKREHSEFVLQFNFVESNKELFAKSVRLTYFLHQLLCLQNAKSTGTSAREFYPDKQRRQRKILETTSTSDLKLKPRVGVSIHNCTERIVRLVLQ